MIEVQNLVKWFGPTLAVDNVSFEIAKGKVVGFLGPNGAGKSTTIRMLTGFLPPTSGVATVAGHDVFRESEAARASIGYLPESTPLYPEMRVEEYLQFRGRLMGMDRKRRHGRINVVCDRCGLTDVRKRVIGHLSKGNRQRVGIAQALLHDPPVLVLDEPTAGLDPTQIGHVRDLIRELGGDHTILLSSHILPEIEKTADHVMILAGGVIVAEGSPDELRHRQSARLIIEVKAEQAAAVSAIKGIDGVGEVDASHHDGWTRLVISSDDEGKGDNREAVGAVVLSNGWQMREMSQQAGSLEQFFIEVTAMQDQASGKSA